MKKYFFILILLVITVVINAQIIPDTLWTKTYGGLEMNLGVSMQQTFDNGFILIGTTYSPGTDIWLIKTDEFGNIEWDQTLGGTGSDYAHSVKQTSDSGYIIAGQTSSYGAGEADGWLIKTDEFGNEEWSQTFGQEEYDGAYSAQQTIDEGYIIIGFSYFPGETHTDSWLIKTDEFGNVEWNQIFGGNADDQIYCVQQTSDNGFVLTGHTNSYGSDPAWLIKTDEFGNEEWSQTFGGSRVHSVQQTIDDGYILTGYNNTSYYSDAWLLKTDELGNEVWNQTYDTGYDEEFRSVYQTIDGGYIMAGCTDKFNYSESDVLLMKTDVNGDEEWRKTYGYSGIDRANSVQKISENNFVVLGFTNLTGSPDFWLLRLGLETSINNNPLLNNKIFVNNFPNPFNPSTSIEFTINYNSHIELSIYNIKGQKIKTLAQNEFSKGSHLIIWNGDYEFNKPVSSGVYFYKLKVNGIIETMKKCLLLK